MDGGKMAVGLECYNEDGKLILSVNDRITKVVGTVHISANGSVSNNDLNQGTIWYYPYRFVFPANSGIFTFPEFSSSGNTIRWNYPSNNRKVEMDLIYGVY